MQTFMRNKLVSVRRLDDHTLAVHGVLDDSIYSIELDLEVRIPDLVCTASTGRFLRWTTPECPKAIDLLSQAVGFDLNEGIEDTIHKVIGRTSCRHFANLMIECAYGVREALKRIDWQSACRQEQIGFAEFVNQAPEAVRKASASAAAGSEKKEDDDLWPEARPIKGPAPKDGPNLKGGDSPGWVIDLHLHSLPASPCATLPVDAMITEAKRIGLSGICLTDHNYVWSEDKVKEVSDRHGFLVLRGTEIVTDQGDMLVFGFHEPVRGIIRLQDLKALVDGVGGFMVAAHPFRGFLTFGADQLGLTPEKASQREMFQHVHGIEILNGKVTRTENELAGSVANLLSLRGLGGSDAHDAESVGLYATRFERPVTSEAELLEALHTGRIEAVSFRGKGA